MANEKWLIDINALPDSATDISEDGRLFVLWDAIVEAPTVDAVEVVHARKAESAISETGLKCAACHSDIDRDAVFCKYCGAKMDGGNEDV